MPEEVAEQQIPVPQRRARSLMGKMLFVIFLTVVSSFGGGVTSYLLINRTLAQAKVGEASDKTAPQKPAEILEKNAVIPLEPFVVNLADTDAARYLRIKISLMVDDKAKAGDISDNQALQLKIRDLILDTLTTKRSRDLINAQGKQNLRSEIQQKLAIYFQEPKIVDVMFTEFVIQL